MTAARVMMTRRRQKGKTVKVSERDFSPSVRDVVAPKVLAGWHQLFLSVLPSELTVV